MRFLILNLKSWDSHHRLFCAGAIALLAAILARGHSVAVWLAVIWDAFTLTVLFLAWVRIVTAHPRESSKTARLQDSSRATIFLFVVLGAIASIFTVAHLLGSARGRHGGFLAETLGLAFGTLIASWSLIHTIFALRYAHLFYGDSGSPEPTRTHRGGLEFPGEKAPDYLDFAYFSFVIGMTGQVSDVAISGRSLRRLALLHGWLSFGFNTVILAISINIASGLFS